MTWRKTLQRRSPSWIGHDARRCAFNIDGSFGTKGPGWYFLPSLPDQNWAVSVMPSDLGAALHFISQNRCVPRNDTESEVVCYDVLVHPNTGCLLNDHREWQVIEGRCVFQGMNHESAAAIMGVRSSISIDR